MATAFNICALIEHWRVDIPPGLGANESHGNDVRDPKWYSPPHPLLPIKLDTIGPADARSVPMLTHCSGF